MSERLCYNPAAALSILIWLAGLLRAWHFGATARGIGAGGGGKFPQTRPLDGLWTLPIMPSTSRARVRCMEKGLENESRIV